MIKIFLCKTVAKVHKFSEILFIKKAESLLFMLELKDRVGEINDR